MARGFFLKFDEKAYSEIAKSSSGTRELVQEAVTAATNYANNISAGFRTSIYHDHETGETVGNTQPSYEGNVQDFKGEPVGIVYTANYSAMKNNHEFNTLLKSLGGTHV